MRVLEREVDKHGRLVKIRFEQTIRATAPATGWIKIRSHDGKLVVEPIKVKTTPRYQPNPTLPAAQQPNRPLDQPTQNRSIIDFNRITTHPLLHHHHHHPLLPHAHPTSHTRNVLSQVDDTSSTTTTTTTHSYPTHIPHPTRATFYLRWTTRP